MANERLTPHDQILINALIVIASKTILNATEERMILSEIKVTLPRASVESGLMKQICRVAAGLVAAYEMPAVHRAKARVTAELEVSRAVKSFAMLRLGHAQDARNRQDGAGA